MNDFLLRMKSLLGDEFDEFLKFYNSDDFIKGLRVNTLKCLPEKLCSLLDFELKKTPFCDEGFYVPSDVKSIGNNPLHHAGAFYGGAKLNGTGLLWSNEIVRNRANILLSNIERMGISNAVVSNCRPDELCKRLENRFDRILVDAPCSGEGMFRKNDAEREWSIEHVKSCAARQLLILNSAKDALKNGGYMVYSTCTFSKEENEGVISRFLTENPDFELVDSGVTFGRPTLDYARRIFPMDGGEGHFAAKLHKKGEPYSNYSIPKKNNKIDSKIFDFYDSIFIDRPFGENIEVIKDKIIVLPQNYNFDVKGLQILRAGIILGEIVKNRIEPHHSAFTAAKKENCKSAVDFDVNSKEIAAYLHGEEIAVSQDVKGYTAVCVNGITTGFGKASNSRLKNKYPKGLRILR